jgi:hypothetical protein
LGRFIKATVVAKTPIIAAPAIIMYIVGIDDVDKLVVGDGVMVVVLADVGELVGVGVAVGVESCGVGLEVWVFATTGID